jgi:hypothetical protein
VQQKEREEAERLRKLHTFHARPVPKSSRMSTRSSAQPYHSADRVRSAPQPKPFNTSIGSHIPHTPDRRSRVAVATPPATQRRLSSQGLRS